jgi:tetratricopeptide (TPR) repeat protein
VYAAQEELADPKTYTEAIQQTAAPASEYFERRRIAREKLMSDARNKIPQEIYSDFEHGRLLRKTGKLIEAIDVLSQVTRKQSDFYLAWYNLALAYMAANMNEKADAAFTKAIALEPAQPARDASLYNSYGWFLYLGKRYEEAIKAFEQALSIDPAHATAKNNLEAAKKMLR